MKLQKIWTHSLVLGLLVLPVTAGAAGLVPCGGAGEPGCDFNQLLVMVNTIVHFILFDLAIPLAAFGFMWAGASLVLNQEKEHAWSEAKERFQNIGLGFLIILAAFVGIKFVLAQFLNTDAGFTTFLLQ